MNIVKGLQLRARILYPADLHARLDVDDNAEGLDQRKGGANVAFLGLDTKGDRVLA